MAGKKMQPATRLKGNKMPSSSKPSIRDVMPIPIWPLSGTPSEWIDKSDPNYTPSIYGDRQQLDVTGAGIMKEVEVATSLLKSVVSEAKDLWRMKGKDLKDVLGASNRVYKSNPGGEWLKYEMERAASGKINGSKTAGVEFVEVPVDELLKLEGRMGEHKRLSFDDKRVKELAESIKKEGLKSPPFLNVEYDGSVNINEGNHRIRAAKLAGLDWIPVEIGYYAGGERAEGPMSLKRLLEFRVQRGKKK